MWQSGLDHFYLGARKTDRYPMDLLSYSGFHYSPTVKAILPLKGHLFQV